MEALPKRFQPPVAEGTCSQCEFSTSALAVATGVLDVASAPPRRRLFAALAACATEPREKERLLHFASPEGRDDLATYCSRERRSLLEVRCCHAAHAWCIACIASLHHRFNICYMPQCMRLQPPTQLTFSAPLVHHHVATNPSDLALNACISLPQVLKDFPSCQLPLERLLEVAPHLKPRKFSISSSPAAHPNRVHVTVAEVDYRTPFRRRVKGLCSSWLASLPVGCAFLPTRRALSPCISFKCSGRITRPRLMFLYNSFS
jgi:sulfite reductase alpha subunit-like flavoprotein